MTTDNRTNEPTPEQVEAAAKEYAWNGSMRAALVAAQGAAPQAESVPKSSYISPSLPSMIRNLWKSDPSENSVRTALKLAGDLIQELIDLRAAPVLPPSAVDEAALIREAKAEALEEAAEKFRVNTWLDVLKPAGGMPGLIRNAESIGEWLLARAAEYLKGEDDERIQPASDVQA